MTRARFSASEPSSPPKSSTFFARNVEGGAAAVAAAIAGAGATADDRSADEAAVVAAAAAPKQKSGRKVTFLPGISRARSKGSALDRGAALLGKKALSGTRLNAQKTSSDVDGLSPDKSRSPNLSKDRPGRRRGSDDLAAEGRSTAARGAPKRIPRVSLSTKAGAPTSEPPSTPAKSSYSAPVPAPAEADVATTAQLV